MIYTSFNEAYRPLWEPFRAAISRYNPDIPICVFTDQPGINADIVIRKAWDPMLHKLWIADYDLGADLYLYLDLDVLCVGRLDSLFDELASDPRHIHGRTEHADINLQGPWHRAQGAVFPTGTPAYNAGTFGFRWNMHTTLGGLQSYTCDNPAMTEQVPFNAYLHRRDAIRPTLDQYVHLHFCDKDAGGIHTPKPLIHFLGNCGNVDMKLQAFDSYARSNSH